MNSGANICWKGRKWKLLTALCQSKVYRKLNSTHLNRVECTCIFAYHRRFNMDIFYTGNVAWLHLDGCPRNLSQGQPVCKWKWKIGSQCKTTLSYSTQKQTSDKWKTVIVDGKVNWKRWVKQLSAQLET